MPLYVDKVEECVDRALAKLGNRIVMGTPLRLGKPNQLINAFYRRAVANPEIPLEIPTALSLERPRSRTALEKQFLQPFVDRLFGEYPPLDYMLDLRAGATNWTASLASYTVNFKSAEILLRHKSYLRWLSS